LIVIIDYNDDILINFWSNINDVFENENEVPKTNSYS